MGRSMPLEPAQDGSYENHAAKAFSLSVQKDSFRLSDVGVRSYSHHLARSITTTKLRQHR